MAAINNNGKIVGSCSDIAGPPVVHGFLLDEGQFNIILDAELRGFLLNEGQLRTIDFPDADGTDVVAINDNGQMAGVYYFDAPVPVDPEALLIPRSIAHGFLLDGDQFSLIGFPNALQTSITSMNAQG